MPEHVDIRELKKPQTIVESVFGTTPPDATPEQKQTVKSITSQEQKDNPKTAAEVLSLPAEQIPSRAELHDIVDRNISSYIDEHSGDRLRTPEQTRHFHQTLDAANLIQTVLEKGYQGLSHGEKQQVRMKILPDMQRLWPEINQAFGTMTTAERQKAMDGILSDPHFEIELKRILDGLRTERTTTEDGAEKTAKDAYDRAEDEYRKTEAQLTAERVALANATTQRHEFNPGEAKDRLLAGLRSMAELDRLKKLSEEELRDKRNDLNHTRERIRQLTPYENLVGGNAQQQVLHTTAQADLPTLRGQETTLNTDIARLRSDVDTIEADIAQRKELEEQKKNVGKDEHDATEKVGTLEVEKDQKKRDMFTAKANLELAKLDKTAKEKAIVQRWQKAFSQAAETVVRDRVAKVEQAKEAIKDTASGAALSAGLEKRWKKANGDPNKAAIRKDYKALVNNNLDSIITDAMSREGVTNPDASMVAAARKKTAEEILANYLKTGGKISAADAKRLVDSDLGEEVITNAAKKNKALVDAMDKLKREGHIPGDWDFGTLLKELKLPKVDKKQLLGIALGVGAAYFVAPQIITALMPHIITAAHRWNALPKPKLPPIPKVPYPPGFNG
jgi:hypothetical protein